MRWCLSYEKVVLILQVKLAISNVANGLVYKNHWDVDCHYVKVTGSSQAPNMIANKDVAAIFIRQVLGIDSYSNIKVLGVYLKHNLCKQNAPSKDIL